MSKQHDSIEEIESCDDCPALSEHTLRCFRLEKPREIPNLETIPEWCPLPDWNTRPEPRVEPSGEFVKTRRKKLKNAKTLFEMGRSPDDWFQSIVTGFSEALDIIDRLEAKLEDRQKARDLYFRETKQLQAEIKQLRSLACPPIRDGDTCICPIVELEAECARWQALFEIIAKHISKTKLRKAYEELKVEQALQKTDNEHKDNDTQIEKQHKATGHI